MRKAPEITLTDPQRATLTKWSRGKRTEARLVDRARIVLLAADGRQNIEIAAELGVSRQKAARWRGRFIEQGLEGLVKDAPRGGRTATEMHRMAETIVKTTTTEKPCNATHWSTRSLAAHLGCDKSLVHRVWKANGLKPHLVKTFKISNDPDFAEKVRDVVGLYLDPPEHALVLSVDEKTSIQALDRTQKSLPMYPGRLGTLTHDYKRHGTTTLFAAIDTARGKVIAQCMKRHRHQEWLKFLKKIDRETPKDLDLHLIVDNYATHKNAEVKKWLAKHQRFHIHFTPTSSSWLNVIERWFGDLTEKRIRRGVFRSVPQLEKAIMEYVHQHNQAPKAFQWTAKADAILEKVERAKAVLDKMQTV